MNIAIYAIIILLVIVVAIVANTIDSERLKSKSKMSFMESMDLTGLPVVTFKNNGNKFNFLLDTGASDSVINSIILEKFKYITTKDKTMIYGVEGNIVEVPIVNINLEYKDSVFKESFRVLNMENSFSKTKKDFGVTIHGILGSAFFRKYRYVLNFDELIAYRK